MPTATRLHLLAVAAAGIALVAATETRAQSICSPPVGALSAPNPEICVEIHATPGTAPPVDLRLAINPGGTAFGPVTVGDYTVAGVVNFVLTPISRALTLTATATRVSLGSEGPGTGVLVNVEAGWQDPPLVGAGGSLQLSGAGVGTGMVQAAGAALVAAGLQAAQDVSAYGFGQMIDVRLLGPGPHFFSDQSASMALMGPPWWTPEVVGVRMSTYFQVNETNSFITVPVGVSVELPTASGGGSPRPGGVTPAGPGPHYECYDVEPDGPAREIEVELADQFHRGKELLGQVVRLCTPVSKNGEEIPNEDVHLVCYKIAEGRAAAREVATRNQLGENRMRVGRARELCVPSIKRLVDEKEPPPPPYEEREGGG